MKLLVIFFTALILAQSCRTKQEQNDQSKSILGQCDEVDIVYYTKDTFIYKMIDTAAANFFKELISDENEKIVDTCESTGQIIYKNKGEKILVADISTKNIKDSISCEYVTYFIANKRYRHSLTYRQGMSIDQIYWEKADPKGNPTPPDIDTTKFKYEEKKNSR